MHSSDKKWQRFLPRFSLSFLLAVVTLLSLWLGSKVKRARDQQVAVESLRKVGVYVRYDFQNEKPPGLTFSQQINWTPPDSPKNTSWIRDLVGEKYFRKVDSVSLCESNIASLPSDPLASLDKIPETRFLGLNDVRITDADLKHLESLHNLESLSVDCPSVTDDGLRYISGLTNLKRLRLHCDGITDAGLKYLTGLTNLESLTLDSDRITDAGLQHISGLTNLQGLTLVSEQITDEGVPYLWNLKKLSGFNYRETWIQDDALQDLWSRLPLLDAEF